MATRSKQVLLMMIAATLGFLCAQLLAPVPEPSLNTTIAQPEFDGPEKAKDIRAPLQHPAPARSHNRQTNPLRERVETAHPREPEDPRRGDKSDDPVAALRDQLFNGPRYPDGYTGIRHPRLADAYKVSMVQLLRLSIALDEDNLSTGAQVALRRDLAKSQALLDAIQSSRYFDYREGTKETIQSPRRDRKNSSDFGYIATGWEDLQILIEISRQEYPDFFLREESLTNR